MAEAIRTTATNFKQAVGRYLDATRSGRVIIERQGRPTAVLISMEDYERLNAASGRLLDTLTGEFDAIVAEMASPEYNAKMELAFDASPESLGAAFQRGRRRKPRRG